MLEDSVEKLGRAFGAPKREGSILLGLPIAEGEGGAVSPEEPGSRGFRAGEAGRATFAAGDADRKVAAGDAERASLEVPATAGLPGRGIPPTREVVAGEPGRAMPVCRRVIWAGGAGTSFFRLLGPATRRRRSSS